MKAVAIASLFALSLAALPFSGNDASRVSPAPLSVSEGEADQIGTKLAEGEADQVGAKFAEGEADQIGQKVALGDEEQVLERLFIRSGPVSVEISQG